MPDLGPCEKLAGEAGRAAALIRTAKDVLVVSHIDADGITSAAIASKTCERLGKHCEVIFAKKMDSPTVDAINKSQSSVVWITDLGSGYLSSYTRQRIVVTDHHVPDVKWRKGQTALDSFLSVYHVNPHVCGVDGSTDACGAAMTYLVSRTIDENNRDLAYLAVIGACGDLQDNRDSRLSGFNGTVLKDAVDNGDVTVKRDVRLFGRISRPLIQYLQYSSDPALPGLTDNGVACGRFFDELNIPLRDEKGMRNWCSLSEDEHGRAEEALEKLVPEDRRHELVGEVYELPKFFGMGELRDAKEFATVLNSCGRYDDAETGVRICFGDASAMQNAGENRAEHRRNISAALSYVKQNSLVQERRYIQYFNAGSAIKETVVGIVAGMILNTEGFRRDLPMIAFADADDGVKVSARADRSLTDRGLDLSVVMDTAAKLVGGYGGGHSVAAGATIPKGKEEEFLGIVEDMISSQII